MDEFHTPTIVISKCLEHESCRYNGSMVKNPFIKKLKDYANFVTVCPEVKIGLPIPREAIRIITSDKGYQLVYSKSGDNITDIMTKFCDSYIESIKSMTIHGVILKTKSPSCGIKDVKVYKSIGKSPSIGSKTSGFFGGRLKEMFPNMAIEDEGRLTNYNIRDHFLTRLYTLSYYSEVKKQKDIDSLIKFHKENKYLLIAYHQTNEKKLEKILTNSQHLSIDNIIDQYELMLKKAISRPLRHGKNTNMILHMFGNFSNKLNIDEKAYFLEQLELYNAKKVPFSVIMALLYSWVLRFNDIGLKYQRIFRPYPSEILEVTDSGKGTD